MNSFYKTLIGRGDSYKYSHFKQYPPGITNNNSYIESRGVDGEALATILPPDADVVFFGLQMFIKKYLSTPITLSDVDKTEKMVTAHGEPFNRQGWIDIIYKFGGYLPIEIEAVPEGTVIAPGNVLVQVRATHEDFAWLASFVETAILRAVWYPSTVATVSREVKKEIKYWLDKTCENPDAELPFKLHDFGARGVSSAESAEIGGLAHLVNFMGTDTVEALWAAEEYYNDKGQESGPVGFSIPASEHSTITAWGREREADAYRNMLNQYGGEGKLLACVSDSYDIHNAVENLWGLKLKDEVYDMGGTLVVRPDSGDPVEMALYCVTKLGDTFGYTENSKGYKVLHPSVRVIQGDGCTPGTIYQILYGLKEAGWSAENIAFGMGGGLLQKVNRDTLRFAMKTSAVEIDGEWVPVSKSPVGMDWKASKAGILAVLEDGDTHRTVTGLSKEDQKYNLLKLVWKCGTMYRDYSFDEVRENAKVS